MKTTKIRCTCGERVSPARQGQHERGRWHNRQVYVRHLLARKLSHAEIARQLGVSRAWVGRKLRSR